MSHNTRALVDRLVALRQEAQADAGRRSRRGMTLFEVMIVIAILLLLMGVLTFGVMGLFGQAQADTAALQMTKINERIQIYKVRKKKVPSSGDGLKAVFPNDDAPLDPWGNPYIYQSPGPNGLDFEIISYGSDGAEGGTGSKEDIKWSVVQAG